MNRLLSSIGRAATNLRQSWLISSITIGIISICLFLVGGYLLITYNLQGVFEAWKDQVLITVYLRDGFPEDDILLLQDRLSSLPEVHAVTYTSKEKALEEFGAMLGEDRFLIEGLDRNPLPASLQMTPKEPYRNLEGVRTILAAIGDDPLVQDIQYGQDWLDRLDKLFYLLDFGALVLGLTLSLAAVFIISNTIKITVMARRDELEIMRLVGATEGFIRLPFLVEGVIQGMAGALISLGLLGGVHLLVSTRSDQPLLKMLNLDSLSFLPLTAMGAILLGGMVLGGLGSLASVGRHSR
ncbi:MAG: ABC transporter permease [bacterium]|nr:MAG: ABC transporter permease [bacterium]